MGIKQSKTLQLSLQIILIIHLFLGFPSLCGQCNIFSRNSIHIKEGSSLYVTGDIQLANDSSDFINNGAILLEKDWINNSDSTALVGNGKGSVNLIGDYQEIKGTNVTQFYELNLNNVNSIKQAEIDIIIDSLILLNGAILETKKNTVTLLNTNPNSLQWSNNGYISTNEFGGQFIQKMDTALPYSFPLGNSTLLNNYRVIEITPTQNDTVSYGASLIVEDINNTSGESPAGSIGPFSELDKENNTQKLNKRYFFTVTNYGDENTSKVNFYFDKEDAENHFTSVAKWDKSEKIWKDENYTILPATNLNSNIGSPNKIATKTTVLDSISDVYTFIDSDLNLPTGFSPDGDGVNDFLVFENLENYPENELVILNRWGSEIYNAAPYTNDWNGEAVTKGIYLQGKKVENGTYFYILKLSKNIPPIKRYIEIKKAH